MAVLVYIASESFDSTSTTKVLLYYATITAPRPSQSLGTPHPEPRLCGTESSSKILKYFESERYLSRKWVPFLAHLSLAESFEFRMNYLLTSLSSMQGRLIMDIWRLPEETTRSQSSPNHL